MTELEKLKARLAAAEKLIDESNLPNERDMHRVQRVAYYQWHKAKQS